MNNATRTVGIDPGLRGALALVAPTGLSFVRMPTYTEERSTKDKTFIDASRVFTTLRDWKPDLVVIEDVWSSPQMGVVGAFSFGEGKGILKGVCAALSIEPLWVHPSVWKAAMKVTADKATCRALAQRLFPSSKIKSADEAEAALLAVYGMIVTGRRKVP